MRSFSTTVAALAVLGSSLVSAAPTLLERRDTCLTAADAEYLVTGFASLISAFDATVADKLLYKDFTDISDSINTLGGFPLGSITFPSKAAFIGGQGSQPPVPFDVLAIGPVSCDGIAFRWQAYPGAGMPVKGINILGAIQNEACEWQINSVFSEFNSIVWAEDLGATLTYPTA